MAQSTWNAIVQRALLGTERVAAPAPADSSGDLAPILERLAAADAERALLGSAAIVGAYESAGRLPLPASPSTVEVATEESDDLPPAPANVARFLTTMLGGVNSEVLREWLSAVAARGWRLPSAMLPALLEVGRNAPYYQSLMHPVLGARGRWLAARNADWKWGVDHAPADEAALQAAWELGTPEDRAATLTAARRRDAGLGRKLLESTWESEAASQRSMLLSRLVVALGPEDEPFLERAQDDRRQEVRHIAASLLCHLPASALAARMSVRAQAALQWKPGRLLKGAEIVVEPPPELDAAMTRDGIDKKPPQGMGERAWWLTQIVATVPPRVWSETWSATPEAIIAAANKGDWAQALTEGWARASVVHRDAAWAEALLAAGVPSETPVTRLVPKISELLEVLPVDRREAFVSKIIRDNPASDLAFIFIGGATDHAWSEGFARTVLDRLRKRFASSPTQSHAADYFVRDVIPRLALCVPPTLAGATENWPTGEAAAGFDRPLDRFINVLTFRRELAQELDR